MNISSRTPEGSPNRCRVCGAAVRIEPSRPPGDAPCPHCGALLWFNGTPSSLKNLSLSVLRQLLLSSAVVVAAVLALMLVARLFGLELSVTEYAIVSILAVLLFGRPLPEVGRRLGEFAVRGLRN